MKLGIIVGSVRQGRVSAKIAKWVENEAKNLSDSEVIMIDLIDYPLPMFNDAVPPQYNPDRKPEAIVRKYIDKVGECDAIAIVTPEYNRSYSGVLKNALDNLDFQLKHKPVLLVAHGSTGGAQAVGHLRGVIPGLNGITIPTAVMLSSTAGHVVNDEGQLDAEVAKNPYGSQTSLRNALSDLKWFSDALVAAK